MNALLGQRCNVEFKSGRTVFGAVLEDYYRSFVTLRIGEDCVWASLDSITSITPQEKLAAKPTGQSRFHSVLEAVANTAVGYLVALASQLAVFPMFDIHIPFSSNLAIGAWFTVISLVRGYVLRRWFNGLKFKKAHP